MDFAPALVACLNSRPKFQSPISKTFAWTLKFNFEHCFEIKMLWHFLHAWEKWAARNREKNWPICFAWDKNVMTLSTCMGVSLPWKLVNVWSNWAKNWPKIGQFFSRFLAAHFSREMREMCKSSDGLWSKFTWIERECDFTFHHLSVKNNKINFVD